MFLSGMLTRGRILVKASWLAPLARWGRWLAAAAWMGGIFYVSHQSQPAGVTADLAQATAAHLVLYAGLALILFWALAGNAGRTAGRPAGAPAWVLGALSFALAVLYGVTDEVHQAFVPGRSASEVDIGVDAAGAALGVGAAVLAARFLRIGHRRS